MTQGGSAIPTLPQTRTAPVLILSTNVLEMNSVNSLHDWWIFKCFLGGNHESYLLPLNVPLNGLINSLTSTPYCNHCNICSLNGLFSKMRSHTGMCLWISAALKLEGSLNSKLFIFPFSPISILATSADIFPTLIILLGFGCLSTVTHLISEDFCTPRGLNSFNTSQSN